MEKPKTLFILLEDIIEIINNTLDETFEVKTHFVSQDLCCITFKRKDKTHQLKIEDVNQNIIVKTESYHDSVDVELLQGFLEGYTACLCHFL